MKRSLVCIVLALLVVASCCGVAYADNRGETVYITKTGKCYHTATCGYLRKSCIEVTLEYAVSSGYNRCDKCHPPVPDFEIEATPVPKSSSGSSAHVSASAVRSLEDDEDRDVEITYERKKNTVPYIFGGVMVAVFGYCLYTRIDTWLLLRKVDKEKKDEM